MTPSELHFPWIELAILLPLIGAMIVSRCTDPDIARKWCVVFSGLSFVTTLAEWQDFLTLNAAVAEDRWHWMTDLFGGELFLIDNLNAPLIPLVALLFFLTAFTTLRTKMRRFSFSRSLISQSLVLGTFSCRDPWGVVVLLSLGTIPPWFELRSRKKSTRVYTVHMAVFVALLWMGRFFVDDTMQDSGANERLLAMIPLLLAVLIRSGIAPFHCWITDLFEKATFSTALLYVVPLTGAYAAVRLVLPIAPSWVLRSIGLLSLITAVYASGMALIQRDGRRLFCYLFLSHSALVLVGLDSVSPIGLTGGLCVWLSVGLGLGGFGLTLRALESRIGKLSLTNYQGLYYHNPNLAMFFVLTGLASIGFPGTIGFVGTELLVDGAVEIYPYVGVAMVMAAALNGIAFVHAYFLLFTGRVYHSSVSLRIRQREQLAVLFLTMLIIMGGLFPQPGILSRYHAAEELLNSRLAYSADGSSEKAPASHSPHDQEASHSKPQPTPPHSTPHVDP